MLLCGPLFLFFVVAAAPLDIDCARSPLRLLTALFFFF